ncbi:hypothetical protein HHI36_003229 [Cryptolaemus montrouzieri]|uniref:Uncharacterized protein n=1 Tax=Cryptolaemus montrouzieri TaxID=559131 RepID=A0ABD2PD37_9CUCU
MEMKTAEKYGIKPATLQHPVEKFKTASEENQSSVYTAQQEKILSEYLLDSTKCIILLTLAYKYAAPGKIRQQGLRTGIRMADYESLKIETP